MVLRIYNAYREAYSGLPREIWILSLIMLINRAGTMVMLFFILYLTNVFGFSNQVAGGIISLSALGGIFGALFGGWFADRFGSIKAQIVFLILVGFHFFVMLLAQSLVEITLALFVLMFLNEAVRPGLHSACLDYCEPHQQKRSMGLLRLTINLGMAIGPVIGGFMAEYELWNGMFILDGLTCIASAILLFLFFGFGINRHPALEGSEKKEIQPVQSPWRDQRMLSFGIFYLLMLIVFIQVASTFIKYLQEVYGFSESQIGLINAINPLLIVAVEMVIIKAIEGYSTIRTIAVGSLLLCLGFGLLPFGTSTAFCIFTVVVWTFGEIFAFPMAAAYVAELSNERNRGSYMGFITVMFSCSMIIGPLIGLSLYEIDKDLPWYLALLVGAISFLFLWNMKTENPESQPIVQVSERD